MAEGAQHTPTPREMLESAAKENGRLLGSDDTPAHVMAKAIDNSIKLAGAMAALDDPDVGAGDTVSIFEQLDNLPPDRAANLLRAEVERREEELLALRVRLEHLESPMLVVQVPDAVA